MTDLEIDIERTAEELRKQFVAFKREQLGKKYTLHPRFRALELWIAAAEHCQFVQADPYDFVRAAFLYCPVTGGPFPQQLATQAGVKWYKQYAQLVTDRSGKRPASILKEELLRLLQEIGRQMCNNIREGKSPRQFLLDTYNLPLYAAPAFARVLLLPKDPDIIKEFGKKARSEIMSNPKLLALLQEMRMDMSWLEYMR